MRNLHLENLKTRIHFNIRSIPAARLPKVREIEGLAVPKPGDGRFALEGLDLTVESDVGSEVKLHTDRVGVAEGWGHS